MAMPLAVVLLPGPGAVVETLASVEREVGEDVPLLSLATGENAPAVSGGRLASATPEETLARADVLAFARAGDRWCAGALEARLRPFNARPAAMLGVAGHVVVDARGGEVMTVRAPVPSIDADELLLRRLIEPATVLVRSDALDTAGLELIARAHGDALVWSRIVHAHGLVPSMELAAEVALDVERHGHAAHTRLPVLLAAIGDAEACAGPGGSTLRRELLRRLYLEPQLDPALEAIDLAALLGASSSTRLAAAIEDLQWALERQFDALTVERLGWAHGEIRPEDRIPETTEVDLLDAQLKAEEFWNEIKVRDAEITRLHMEIARRDATIDRLSVAERSA